MRPKAWTLGLVASIGLHGALIVAALLYVARSEPLARPATSGAAHSGTGRRADDRRPPPADFERFWRQAEARAAMLSPEQRISQLEKKLPELHNVRPGSAEAVASLVEKAHRVDRDRAYAPRPGATGRFDADTAVLYDITRSVKDGRAVYEYTFVDSAGRTISTEIPEDKMSPEDLRSFRVFEMTRRSPALRRLVDAAIRIADKKLQDEKK